MDDKSAKKLKIALRRQEVIRPLALSSNVTSRDIENAQLLLGKSGTTVGKWIREYRACPVATTLMPGHRTSDKRKSRLPAKTIEITSKRVREDYLGRKEALPASELWKLIKADCENEDTTVPSLRHIQRCVKEIDEITKAKARKSKKKLSALKPRPNHHTVENALEKVQIDHTLADVIIDLTEYGLGKKRPWVTLIIDVATRMVVGYYIGLKSPSAASCGLAVLQGILPKRRWLESIGISYENFEKAGIDEPWPVEGPPILISSDRAREFKSYAFIQGCQQLGIKTHLRPPRTPHYGGHIERLIGTFMGDVHMLPGTTFSNVQVKQGYNSEREAYLTLDQFERWFALNILKYHLQPHQGLNGRTPLSRWNELKSQYRISKLPMPDAVHVYSAFLPSETRKVHQQGILFQKQYYHHPHLNELIGKSVVIKYHKARLNSLWVCLDGITPTFEVSPIGGRFVSQHLEAPRDHTPTLVQIEECKRHQDMSDAIAAHLYDWVKQIRQPKPVKKLSARPKGHKAKLTGISRVPKRVDRHDLR